MNFEGYARALAAKMGWRDTLDNIDVIVAWCAAEGSQADYNPLDTEEGGEPGETNYNSVGVKNYPTLDEGLQAVADTLNNGLYANVLQSFQRSNPAATTAQAIDECPWGTKNVTGVLAEVQNNRTDYYTRPIYPVTAPARVQAPTSSEPAPAPVVEKVTALTVSGPVPIATFTWPQFSIADESQVLPGVKALQAVLSNVYGLVIAIDGQYGPVTEGAVKSFQRSNGLTVDGIAGEETLTTLYALG